MPRKTGRPPIKRRWADINKGHENQPNHHIRTVAKDIKTNDRPELFAATLSEDVYNLDKTEVIESLSVTWHNELWDIRETWGSRPTSS